MKKSESKRAESPSDLIDARIAALGDWRGEMLSRLRALIKEVAPNVVEEWKWRGTPVWEQSGMICTGETYKNVVKTTFAKGALLEDPSKLFNSSLDGNVRRAIDFHEGEKVNDRALKALIRAAVALNESSARGKSAKPGKSAASTQAAPSDDATLKKLRLKPGQRAMVLNAPDTYAAIVEAIPAAGATLVRAGSKNVDFVQVFATTRAELTKLGPKLRGSLADDGILWVSYPKGKAIPTDINRDSTRETLQAFGLEAVAQVAIDDVWSALRFKKV